MQKKFKVNKNFEDILVKTNKILLFMGRLDRQKGLVELITAWNQLVNQAEIYNWWLLIAGFGELRKLSFQMQINLTQELFSMGPYLVRIKILFFKNQRDLFFLLIMKDCQYLF